MNKFEKYQNAVFQYYQSSERPYKLVGTPNLLFNIVKPDILFEEGTRLILYGPAGSGKTTLLDWVCYYNAKSNSHIPIFVSLRNYGSNLDDLLRVSISKFDNELNLEDLLYTSSPLQLAFLFDGLDEVPTPFLNQVRSSINKISDLFPKASIIITSRFTSDPLKWENWKKLEVPNLNHRQIQDYLFEVNKTEELWNKLKQNPKLLELASRPAFLHTIRNAWVHGLDFREYLMREIPMYTAWRGHTKSQLSHEVSYTIVDDILTQISLALVLTDTNEFSKEQLLNIIDSHKHEMRNSKYIVEAILSTDVIIESHGKYFSFAHKSLLESYAARGLVNKFRSSDALESILQSVLKSNYASQVIKYFLSILKKDEFNSLANIISPNIIAIIMELGKDIIAERLPEITNQYSNLTEEVFTATTVANKFLISQTNTRRDILVLAVHGFNTRGDWKNRLGLVLTRATDGERFLYSPWDYGNFRLGILFPWSRQRQVKKFQSFYNSLIPQFTVKPEVCVVAHSFGTYIIAHAFRKFPEIHFDRVLFLGSALPRRFKWTKTSNRIEKMLNILGSSDIALFFARICPGLGDAGRRGFINPPGFIIQKSENYSDHSDLFGEEYMRKVWLPFFRDGSEPIN